MRETLPYDARSQKRAQPTRLARLGHATLELSLGFSRLVQTAASALISSRRLGAAARRVVRRIALAQVLYTGVHAVTLISVIGLLIGGTLIIQTHLMAPAAGGEMLGTILVAVVVRELAPLVTAIVVTGRSGTAIATELGNMKANSEVAALASMGIDPAHYIVLPRLIGATVSVLVLTVYFAFVAILGGYAVSLLIASPSFTAIQAGASRTLMLADLPLFLAKAGGLGALVGWLPCHYGLSVKSSPTEVPQQASRAVVRCMGACVAYNLVVTAGFYAWVGPPIR